MSLCNGVLVGFVSITAGAHVLEPWAALIAGFVGAWVFEGMCWSFLKLRIDDPLAAAPMHGWVGIWACICVGFLAKKEYVIQSYGTDGERGNHYGAFYPGACDRRTGVADHPGVRTCAYAAAPAPGPGPLQRTRFVRHANPSACTPLLPPLLARAGGGGRLLASQLIGVLVIAAWVCLHMGTLFFILKLFKLLRISEEDEHRGLDASKHGGSAYNPDAGSLGKGDNHKVVSGGRGGRGLRGAWRARAAGECGSQGLAWRAPP